MQSVRVIGRRVELSQLKPTRPSLRWTASPVCAAANYTGCPHQPLGSLARSLRWSACSPLLLPRLLPLLLPRLFHSPRHQRHHHHPGDKRDMQRNPCVAPIAQPLAGNCAKHVLQDPKWDNALHTLYATAWTPAASPGNALGNRPIERRQFEDAIWIEPRPTLRIRLQAEVSRS